MQFSRPHRQSSGGRTGPQRALVCHYLIGLGGQIDQQVNCLSGLHNEQPIPRWIAEDLAVRKREIGSNGEQKGGVLAVELGRKRLTGRIHTRDMCRHLPDRRAAPRSLQDKGKSSVATAIDLESGVFTAAEKTLF